MVSNDPDHLVFMPVGFPFHKDELEPRNFNKKNMAIMVAHPFQDEVSEKSKHVV